MAGNVIVGGTAAGGYTQRINTGSHTLTADEPLDDWRAQPRAKHRMSCS